MYINICTYTDFNFISAHEIKIVVKKTRNMVSFKEIFSTCSFLQKAKVLDVNIFFSKKYLNFMVFFEARGASF